jgi:hypothetical protein
VRPAKLSSQTPSGSWLETTVRQNGSSLVAAFTNSDRMQLGEWSSPNHAQRVSVRMGDQLLASIHLRNPSSRNRVHTSHLQKVTES